MVNGLSFSGGYPNYSQKDVENIVKYVGGTEIVNKAESPLDGMGLLIGMSGLTSGYQGVKWLKNSYKDSYDKTLTGDALKQAKKDASPLRNGGWRTSEGWGQARTNLKSAWDVASDEAKLKGAKFKENGGWKSLNAYKAGANEFRAQSILDCIPKPEKLAKLDEATQAIYKRAEEAAKLAKEGGVHSDRLIAIGDKYLSQGRALAQGQIKATGFFGKLFEGISKYTGLTKTSGWVKNLAKESPTVSKILKYGKGNGAFLAITGGIELLTQVIPTFATMGIGAGLKQIFKSGTKTAAQVGGWAAGSAIGGMAAGALVGSCTVPIVGTLVGGAVGLIGGCIGSWLASKATDGIVGKNELDIQKEEQAKQASAQLAQDPQALEKVVEAGVQKAQQSGMATDDDKVAMQSLVSVASRLNQQGVSNPNQINYNA